MLERIRINDRILNAKVQEKKQVYKWFGDL